ncbi:hypothetical protein GJ744_003781 [Endocarpon pusillum]|uniref:DASH complex subunit DUO1 n=1 Tax=Endocarpon pusillum TaxID=364733 RepID=A0A8H7E804_9EURO|nr:hypothetical protein GJ744_003781 [Endocarpon pusillum]
MGQDELDIGDDDLEAPPSKPRLVLQSSQMNAQPRSMETPHEKQDAREERLRRELQTVRKVNEAIEGAIESLAKARNSMKTISTTVHSASSLLQTWTAILSQTEHNQRLILNPSWHGSSQDLADSEQETLLKQQAAERRECEEQERRTEAARKAEADERRRAEGAAARLPRGGARGRGRVWGAGVLGRQEEYIRLPIIRAMWLKVDEEGEPDEE